MNEKTFNIDEEIIEILNFLNLFKDRTLRQIGYSLGRDNATLLALYDKLKEMSEKGLVRHRVKQIRLDVFSITSEGRKLLYLKGNKTPGAIRPNRSGS